MNDLGLEDVRTESLPKASFSLFFFYFDLPHFFFIVKDEQVNGVGWSCAQWPFRTASTS